MQRLCNSKFKKCRILRHFFLIGKFAICGVKNGTKGEGYEEMCMTKTMFKCYLVVGLLGFIFLVYVACSFHTDMFRPQSDRQAEKYENFTIKEKTEDTIILENTLPVYDLDDVYLSFVTYHHEVKIFTNGKKIYELKAGDNAFGSTTGQVWNFVKLKNEYKGKSLHIELYSPYDAVAEPDIYIGGKIALYGKIFGDNIFSYALCIVTILLGIVMIVYWCYVRSKTYISGSLLFLGMFAVMLGIWSINEVPIQILVFQNHVVSSYLAFVSLMLLPVPFLLFIKDLYHEKDNTWWYVIGYISLGNVLLCLGLQIFDVLDLKQSLWITHIVFAMFAVAMGVFTIREVRRGAVSMKVKANIICIGLDLIGLILDTMNYYFNWYGDTNLFGRLFFFIHIVVLGWVATKESAKLMKLGKKAEIYEKLAYRDALTELLNRTAFDKELADRAGDEEGTYILMLDLNNLKQCNDTQGHDAGDRYIKTASEMIQNIFGKMGNCYRIGGDEFCVVSSQITDSHMKILIEELTEGEEKYNQMNPRAKIGIAWGHAKFDRTQDDDLNDTRKRADSRMYQNKKEMKEG